jgi:hypothetical protein
MVEGAVSVDLVVTRYAAVDYGSKCLCPFLTASTPSLRVSVPATEPIVRTRSSVETDPPIHRVPAMGGPYPAGGEHRPVRNQIEDEIVRAAAAG